MNLNPKTPSLNSSWRLVNFSIGLALVVVLLGGWTRLNDAGLGCPDWPACYGHFVLPPAHQVEERILIDFPGHAVDLKKGWLEMVHRYAASLLGLMILLQAVIAIRKRSIEGYPLSLSCSLLVLVIIQGLFGMWTVTLKLVPWVVTLHLLGGMATLALLVRLRQRLKALKGAELPTGRHAEPAVVMLVVALFIQISLGGWTSTNYAGWACDHWLVCHQGNVIEYDFATGMNPVVPLGPNYEGGMLPAEARAAIQISHRIGALMFVLSLLLATWRLRNNPALKPWLGLVWVVTGAQIVLGVLNVVFQLPLSLATAHHAAAVMLLLSVMAVYGRACVKRKRTEVIHGYLSPG
ncbi:COX15/CtaA family protein [Marinobacterium mangrovicola]|uniref:Cytochrome c oxidase assembly protein subunit 15 n=1 Tax=Marinobacterium mangrovicola TaxID=1476959 RepID=A0A4R1G707_9GAMM|nr:COX15/CtaA family protein [Marinobacterium mangrovicola]TCK02255.1 cytochrome c oxidase assembly protein subunit 15 [Marinobacterium mangrovicola]